MTKPIDMTATRANTIPVPANDAGENRWQAVLAGDRAQDGKIVCEARAGLHRYG